MFSKGDFEGDWLSLASGAFGQVFRVRHKRWRAVYAVKCFPGLQPGFTCDRAALDILSEEAAKMERVKFQHLVSVYGLCDSPVGIVMEHMPGGSLEKTLATHQMTWRLKSRLIHETSLAMNFLNSLRPPLLHLNLKPGNILLDAHMHVKVSDFGLFKWMEVSSGMPYIERSALSSSLGYVAPEILLQSTHPPGTKCDVYSFGIVVWEILNQKKAYAGASMVSIIMGMAAGKRPCLDLICDDSPGECQQVVDLMKRCWDQEPKRRPSFADISVEMDMLLSLIQSPLVDLKKEHLSRKTSLRPGFSGSRGSDIDGFALSQGMSSRDGENDKDPCYSFPQNEVESLESSIVSEEARESHENGPGLLHRVVAEGNLEKVAAFLRRGADVNWKTPCGDTALILAVQKRSLEIVSLLLKHGADAAMPDNDGWTPLHFVAQNGDDRIARLLLDHKADVDARELDGWTPLHLASQNNLENVVRLLLSRQADPNIQESEGRTALHIAAYYGQVKLVKMLAHQGADVEKKQKNQRTPLHLAVEKGKFRAVQYLLKNGAAVNCLDQNLCSPLHLAVSKGKFLICEMLVRYGADVALTTDKGWTPLHLASLKGHVEIVRLLVDNHAQVNAKGSLDWTPLHLATRYSEEGIISELLRHGADPNAAVDSDWTPLHLAVQRGTLPGMVHLLEYKANVNSKNKAGWTPTHLAVLKGDVPILKTLLQAGAQLEREDNTGCTPLQLAARGQKQDIVDLLLGEEFSEAAQKEIFF
ncbi:LOW QUALITY PROTEIN: ankyrin repeat and protein kinase domain-containing protein 1 [Heteronotia binoei]|uniref:LOW QUALITY PROTEIN: ankyrin repeat and protein kinase domain-containing protein 1 n=1 Tax=Heteronotia binoei TaxID=13085 RepID=UPI00292CDF60|nr:LOW QUALITY PROTEIN: ankyrin repeat and protein kinase domain-containing protein 1 [Heteronotia binoei]